MNLKEARDALSYTPSEQSTRILTRIVRSFAYDTPLQGKAEEMLAAYKNRDFHQLALLTELSPQQYSDASSYYRAAQLSAFFNKNLNEADPAQQKLCDDRAFQKFLKSERRVRRYNQIHRLYRVTGKERDHEIRESVRGIIREVLGRLPDVRELAAHADFGPGASIGANGNFTSFCHKLAAKKWTVGPFAEAETMLLCWEIPQLREFLLSLAQEPTLLPGPDGTWGVICHNPSIFRWAWAGLVKWCQYNKLSFVPKKFNISRVIASEPLLSGLLQKAYGDWIAGRLLKCLNIDLGLQEVNSEMAREGSLDDVDGYVTIDLADASGSIGFELTRTHFPEDWFLALDRARSHSWSVDGKTSTPYESFVSMGNGFCFPLQTLLFAAVCVACARAKGEKPDYRVYGDDIIVRKSVGALVIRVLRRMGFRTNSEKTYIDGPFRESCGKDWWLGQDVRPVYVRGPFDDVISLHALHNQLLAKSKTYPWLSETCDLIRNCVPWKYRFVQPLWAQSDGAFCVPDDLLMSARFTRWSRDEWRHEWIGIVDAAVNHYPYDVDHKLAGYVNLVAALKGAKSGCLHPLRRKTKRRVAWF